MPAPSSRALATWRRDAIRRIDRTRAAVRTVVARIPEREIRRPCTQDRWSVKDVLAHLVACDEETLRRLQLIARRQPHRIHWFESMADADRFNARSVARLRRLGVSSLSRRLERARVALVAALENLPLEALDDPSHAYTVKSWLPAPGWSHVSEHLDDVKTWWRGQRAVRRTA